MISLGEKIGKLSNVPVVQCDTLKCESFSALANSIVQPGDNLIIICDEAPITAKERLIDDLSKTYKVRVFKNVRPNPLASDIDYIVSQSDTCDAVVGIGGGSVLDSAKAVAMLKTNGGTLGDYLGNSPKCKVENRAKPLILMPTTAGTGSEMTKVGVFTSETGRKYTEYRKSSVHNLYAGRDLHTG